jgi:PKD repeat protein
MGEQMNIEQLVRSKLEGQEITPSAGTWKHIRRRVRWKQFLRFDPGKFNVFYAAGILVVGAGVAALFLAEPAAERQKEQAAGQEPVPREIKAPPDEARTVMREENAQPEEIPGENVQKETGEIKGEGKANPETTGASESPGTGQSAATQEPVQGEELQQEEGTPAMPAYKTLVAYFTSSVRSGCAPLTVQFYNQSANHTSSSWSMGTGTPVTGENPVHTFTEPGSHHVTMTVMDEGGQTAAFSQEIEVYPVPRADFIIEEGIPGSDGPEAFDLINCSVGASSYSWQLLGEDNIELQGWSSEEFQPALPVSALKTEGRYIRLVATNEHGCSQNTVRELPEPPGPAVPTLRFPTAFSPNPAGPTGGHYSPHEKRNDVFYPVFDTEPLEYRLRIYSRRGELVFETGDIYNGWDGYYHQQRSAPGVYVWMAEGTWKDGEEFMLQGDVTLIWTDPR